MKKIRSSFAVGLLSLVLLTGVTTPGCEHVANILYQLLIQVGREVLRTAVLRLIAEGIDNWVFEKNDPRNRGGIVIADSPGSLTGAYNGKMTITVRDEATDRTFTTSVDNPRMQRDSPDTERWKLDPVISERAKNRLKEAGGGQ